jgi:hypothetical protein
VSTDVHPFNPIHYLESADHNIEVFGQHNLPLSKFSSDIEPSIMLEPMKEVMGYEPTHTSPVKAMVRPSRHRHLTKGSQNVPNVNPDWMAFAVRDFVEGLDEKILDYDVFKQFIHPLDYDTALNGEPGVHGFDPINPKTSMGFPLNCPKVKCMAKCGLKEELGINTTKFVKRETDLNGKVSYVYEIVFDPEIADVKAETESILNWFVNGKRANVIFRANLKDEPVTFKKVEQNKLRVFAGAPVALVIAARMMTLPLLNMMSFFPEEFESAVGVDATGKDWAFVERIITRFGRDRCGDGDFSGYDTSLRPEVTEGAFSIIKHILKRSGYDEEMLKVIDGLATECMFPIYEIDGLLVMVIGTNPSGQPLTVILNGLANSILKRYAYYSMHKVKDYGEIPRFDTVVALITYGDDDNFGVSKDESKFNMMTISQELAKIGIKYTDANKETPTIPFKNITELSFLKRSFNSHKGLGALVGALEKDSIYKSLAVARKPKKGERASDVELCAANLNSALAELYYHGEDEYDRHIPLFEEIARRSHGKCGQTVADYFTPISKDEIKKRFHNTTCAYEMAQEVLHGQSGILEEEEMDIDELSEQLYELWEMFCSQHGYLIQSLYIVNGETELPFECLSVKDIQFRFYCNCISDFNDARLQYGFRSEIFSAARDLQARRIICRVRSEQVAYVYENCLGPIAVPRNSDVVLVNLCRRIRLRGLSMPLPTELDNHVRSYLFGTLSFVRFPETFVLTRGIGEIRLLVLSTTVWHIRTLWSFATVVHAIIRLDLSYENVLEEDFGW